MKLNPEMKTLLSMAMLLLLAVGSYAQNTWNTNGNAPSPNCFIGTTSPVPLVMKTNGIQRLSIDENGKLLVSGLAATDTAAMVVLPDGSLARAEDPGTGGVDCGLLIWDGDGNAASPNCFIGTTNAVPLRIHSNGMERMRVTETGGVVVQGFAAKAPFQVFDHLGMTFNRQDASATDVVRTLGFNLYQDGGMQRHYQLGPAAKIEFASATGMVQWSVAPAQAADAQAAFPLGMMMDSGGRVGIGTAPDGADVLSVGGILRVQQVTNPANAVRLSHNGTNAVLETNGNAVLVRDPTGTLSIDKTGGGNNFLRLGHDGVHAFMETGGGGNAQLRVNAQSAKTVTFGGDILVANHVGVGTTNFWEGNREYKLAVNGHIRAKAAHIYPAWADHVFAEGYELASLDSVGAYIQAHGHLPGVPSASEVAQQGVDVGETEAMLLGKIEELTLYLLEMKQENETIRREMAALRKELGR